MSDRYNPPARASLAFSVAGRDASDYARDLVRDVATPMPAGERILTARNLRLLALKVLDRAVLMEALAGTSWEVIGDALGLGEEEARRRYEPTVAQWRHELPTELIDATIFGDMTTGLLHDHDPEGTALTIDAWIARYRDPWDGPQPVPGPVTRALTD